MTIHQAKEEIKKTVHIYLSKDRYGTYAVPYMKQRPVFMIGAPGIGKTAIVEQVADELGIGLVSYSMTHHTRQSAIGLPFIAEHEYGRIKTRVSEYTMSEILASVYNVIEETGNPEGILFLDEINCVSETLAPAILQFLQYKTFGNHSLPTGWVIVSAGNPPQYNRSVREFDIATRDRLKYIYIEEDFEIWKRYAYNHNVHPAIVAFLEINRPYFFSIRTTTDGPQIATARGWEDLSYAIRAYEANGFRADIVLVSQYITDREISRKFSAFYDLYKKYKEDYRIQAILDGSAGDETIEKAAKGEFGERISLIEMISEALMAKIVEVLEKQRVLEQTAEKLRPAKKLTAAVEKDERQGQSAFQEMLLKAVGETEDILRTAVVSRKMETDETRAMRLSLAMLQDYAELAGKAENSKEQFALIKKDFDRKAKKLASEAENVKDQMEAVFRFIVSAWGTGQEMTYFLSLLTANRSSNTFISRYGCESYYQYNDALLLYDADELLRDEIKKELAL